MSPANYRLPFGAALLFAASVCTAQLVPAIKSVNAPPADGVFRPAASAEQPQQPGKQSSQGPSQPSAVYTIGKEYRIGPNDLLEVEVMSLEKEKETAKRSVRVNAAGSITLPLIGAVTAAGLTQQQLETHIATLLGEKYLQNPQVSVFIKEFTTERITVDGAVTKPGVYPLVGQMTLLRVLALAGGFGPIAKQSQVMLFRQGEDGQRQVATFDVERIRAGQDPDPSIRGDDLVVVQRDPTRAVFRDSLFRDIVDTVNPFNYIGR